MLRSKKINAFLVQNIALSVLFKFVFHIYLKITVFFEKDFIFKLHHNYN